MIRLFIVSESGLVAQGLMELITHTAPEIPVMAVGGGPEGGLGHDQERIYGALEDLYSHEGIIVFYDTEASLRCAREAVADLRCRGIRNLITSSAALLEGAIGAAEYTKNNNSLETVAESLADFMLPKS